MTKPDVLGHWQDRGVLLGKPHEYWILLYIRIKKYLCVLVNIFPSRVYQGYPSGLSGLSGLLVFCPVCSASRRYHNDVLKGSSYAKNE